MKRMNSRSPALLLGIAALLLLPAPIVAGQDDQVISAGEGGEDLAAIIRGMVITWYDVDREVARMKTFPSAAEMTDEALRWQARSMLAGNILLLEEAKRFTTMVDDANVRQWWIESNELDANYVDDNFEKLKNEYLTEFYISARCGIAQLDGVIPDMASFIRNTPKEIKDYYRNNPSYFSQKASTTLVWILFPEAAFSEPTDARRFAVKCRELLLDPDGDAVDLASNYGVFAERWPGCIPKKTVIESDRNSSFHPLIVEFVDGASAGEVSGLIELEGGFVVAQIIEKKPGKTFSFDEVQAQVADQLRREKRNQARLLIVQDLARKERFFFPSDLFERRAGPEPGKEQVVDQPPEK